MKKEPGRGSAACRSTRWGWRSCSLGAAAGALDKEPSDEEPRVWKPVELQSRIAHGCDRRPHQIRNPP
eukprot:9358989-Pyramimonas_sp.AAC.1